MATITPAKYKALGKQFDRLQRRVEVLEVQKESAMGTLENRQMKQRYALLGKWDKKLAKVEKQMAYVEAQIDRYEHG